MQYYNIQHDYIQYNSKKWHSNTNIMLCLNLDIMLSINMSLSMLSVIVLSVVMLIEVVVSNSWPFELAHKYYIRLLKWFPMEHSSFYQAAVTKKKRFIRLPPGGKKGCNHGHDHYNSALLLLPGTFLHQRADHCLRMLIEEIYICYALTL
jgi:hypothetical protein